MEIASLEQKSAEWADMVVASSEHMLEWAEDEGWQLPQNSFVLHNQVQLRLHGLGHNSVYPIPSIIRKFENKKRAVSSLSPRNKNPHLITSSTLQRYPGYCADALEFS